MPTSCWRADGTLQPTLTTRSEWHSSRNGCPLFESKAARNTLESLMALECTILYTDNAVGGLSKTSKMPWYSYSIPAQLCDTGSVLRTVKGSVCEKCYAQKGRYSFGRVQNALERRYRSMINLESWAAHMVHLLAVRSKGNQKYFRWHDSGDLQGAEHLQAIIWIARQLPHIRFWLPTKEARLVSSSTIMLELRDTPNLTVRLSSPMVGKLQTHPHLATSSVAAGKGKPCPAKQQEGKCGECRMCWEVAVCNVDYPLH